MNRNAGEVASARTNVLPAGVAVALEARTHAAAETVAMKVSLRNMVPPGVDAIPGMYIAVQRLRTNRIRSSFGRDRLTGWSKSRPPRSAALQADEAPQSPRVWIGHGVCLIRARAYFRRRHRLRAMRSAEEFIGADARPARPQRTRTRQRDAHRLGSVGAHVLH